MMKGSGFKLTDLNITNSMHALYPYYHHDRQTTTSGNLIVMYHSGVRMVDSQ